MSITPNQVVKYRGVDHVVVKITKIRKKKPAQVLIRNESSLAEYPVSVKHLDQNSCS